MAELHEVQLISVGKNQFRDASSVGRMGRPRVNPSCRHELSPVTLSFHALLCCAVFQVTNNDGSYINKADVSVFPVSKEMSGALVRIAPGELCSACCVLCQRRAPGLGLCIAALCCVVSASASLMS